MFRRFRSTTRPTTRHVARAIEYTIRDSAFGRMLVAGTLRGVCLVRFAEDDPELERAIRREFGFAELARNDVRLRSWAEAIARLACGAVETLDVPLDVRPSCLRRRIWQALRPGGRRRALESVSPLLVEDDGRAAA